MILVFSLHSHFVLQKKIISKRYGSDPEPCWYRTEDHRTYPVRINREQVLNGQAWKSLTP